MGFIQKGVSIEQLQLTGKKIATLCAIAEKLFKPNELEDLLRYISLNESIPMATVEFQQMLKDGPVATKRARAIGEFIKVSKETWAEDSEVTDIPGSMLAAGLIALFANMEVEDGEESKSTGT